MKEQTNILNGLHALRVMAALLVFACHYEYAIHKASLLKPDFDKTQFYYLFVIIQTPCFKSTGSLGTVNPERRRRITAAK